jgi:hypothetical protein
MAGIIYKTLFEIQLLHEYYLTNSDGTTIFDSTINKTDFLLDRFSKDLASVNDSVLYEVPASMESFFKNYYLHLVPKYSGFAVLARVNEQKLPDGTTAYKPFVTLPPDANIPVQLSLKNNLLNAVTNTRINKAVPFAYYFTNEDVITDKTFPFLTADIPLFDPAYIYEQGELYVNDQNNVCIFYLNGDAPDFLPVEGNSYANTSDQLIVPLQFTYGFDPIDNVTHAKFELNDHSGKTVRTYEFKNDLPLKNVTINFSNDQSPKPDSTKEKIITLPQSVVSAENIYTLNVTVNELKTLIHKVIFFEGDNSLTQCWAIINIKPAVDNPDFSLYDADGLIKYRKQLTGETETILPAPVFEVRVKSRINYWRYINDKSGKLKTDSSDPFLEREGNNNLVSKTPRPASYLLTLYKDDNDNTLYLPNPVSDERITIEGRKLYADILVPESKMFPLDTS